MNIYFVRHGESEGNCNHLIQTPKYPLTEKGEEEAHMVADRLEDFSFDTMLVSTFPRARQTADIMNEKLHLPMEYYDCLGEILYPSCVQGLSYDSEEAKPTLDEIQKNFHDPNYRHSDEETFGDVCGRGVVALEMIKARQEENLLVVTHATFIKIMLGLILFDQEFSSYDFIRLRRTLVPRNTGITICEYHPEEERMINRGWKVRSYSDHSHLGVL